MLEDPDWKLEGAHRKRVLEALAYFADPSDLVPDQIPGLGLLDDAIMVELVAQELRPELDAYALFCGYREEEGAQVGVTPRSGSGASRSAAAPCTHAWRAGARSARAAVAGFRSSTRTDRQASRDRIRSERTMATPTGFFTGASQNPPPFRTRSSPPLVRMSRR